METVNIDGYHQMSLLYKAIQDAFLGEHMGDLKRHLRLSPCLHSRLLCALSSSEVLQGSTSKACSLAPKVLKLGSSSCDLGKEPQCSTTAFVSDLVCLSQALFSSSLPLPFFLLES